MLMTAALVCAPAPGAKARRAEQADTSPIPIRKDMKQLLI
jgi:hypothetical protein